MKKITLLYDFLTLQGGLERVMKSQAEWLLNKYQITASFGAVNKNMLNFFPKNVKITEHSNKIFLSKTLKIMYTFLNRRLLSAQKDSSLFISHSFLCSKLAHNMKKRFSIPYIVFLHHPPNFLYQDKSVTKWIDSLWRIIAFTTGSIFGPIMKRIDVKIVRNANLVFANSKYTKKRAKQIYGIDAIVVYPTINSNFKILHRDSSSVIKKFNLPKNFIFCTGRLVPDKRYDLLIQAFSKSSELELIFAGNINEKYKNKLQNLAKKLNCLEKIKFLGFVTDDELIVIYNIAKVFAFPAPKEDFGLVPVESIACGTPVVAWNDNAGPSESITEGVSGFLAKPYDTDDFYKCITKASKLTNKIEISKTIEKFREKSQSEKFISRIKTILG